MSACTEGIRKQKRRQQQQEGIPKRCHSLLRAAALISVTAACAVQRVWSAKVPPAPGERLPPRCATGLAVRASLHAQGVPRRILMRRIRQVLLPWKPSPVLITRGALSKREQTVTPARARIAKAKAASFCCLLSRYRRWQLMQSKVVGSCVKLFHSRMGFVLFRQSVRQHWHLSVVISSASLSVSLSRRAGYPSIRITFEEAKRFQSGTQSVPL